MWNQENPNLIIEALIKSQKIFDDLFLKELYEQVGGFPFDTYLSVYKNLGDELLLAGILLKF